MFDAQRSSRSYQPRQHQRPPIPWPHPPDSPPPRPPRAPRPPQSERPKLHGPGHSHGHGHHHGHGAGHPHSHGGGESSSLTRRALWVAFILNAIFMVIEGGLGLWTGSLALLSDAAHMVSDVAALALALWAEHLSRRPATANRSFGLVRAEVLGAFVNAGLLVLVCGYIFQEAIMNLIHGTPSLPGWPVVIAGVVGLIINLGSALFLAMGDRENLNVRGALAHMLADALGSVGAISAGVFITLGYPEADSIISLAIGALVLWGAWGLLRDSTKVLLQFTPAGIEAEEVEAALSAAEGVREVHDLHIWSLDGRRGVLSAHVVFDPGVPMLTLRQELATMLMSRFQLEHTTIQMEPGDGVFCQQEGCLLTAGRGADE